MQVVSRMAKVAAALAATAAVLGLPAAAQAIQAPTTEEKPARDARAGDRAPVPAATADARATLAKHLGQDGTVAADPITGGLREVGLTDGFLTGPSTDDPAAIGLAYVRAHAAAFGLDADDLAQLQPFTRTTSPDGVTHVTWRQTVAGVPAYDSALFANVTRDGRLVNVGGAPVHDLQPPATDPPLGPSAARAAAQTDLGLAPDAARAITTNNDPRHTTTFSDGTRAQLVTLADPDGDRLAWQLTVDGTDPYVYDMLVDAATGTVLTRHSITQFASAATVHELHPGAAAGGTDGPADLAPWLPSSPTTLSGPNVHAYPDRTSPDGLGNDTDVAPSAGTDFDFPVASVAAAGGQHCPTGFTAPCTWDGSAASSASTNVAQATTQLFYFANRYHDWLAQSPIGFTTSSFNFQGADPVNAEADDYNGFNNANMSTPADGSSPRMQMYLWRSPFPAINGSDDATVVYHEYTHGLTNRLVGNDGLATGLRTKQSAAMGEAWSDYYALDFLIDQGSMTDGPGRDVVMGAYVTDDKNVGIREDALDCPVGSADATHCPGTATAGPGGFSYDDLGHIVASGGNPYFEVHADGEIWAQTLWDIRQQLGALTARALITSALRLSPKGPSFLDMRDALLQADTVAGGTHRAQLWSIFAARGMGYGARTSSADATHAVASFVTPPTAAAGKLTAQSPVPLGDGDAALEPGEAARVSVPIANPGTTALTGVRATLTTASAGVLVGTATASYGTIAPGATAAPATPFAVTLLPTLPCGTAVALTLTVTSDQGAVLTAPLTLRTGGGQTTVNGTAGLPLAIQDNNRAATTKALLTLPTAGRVGHLRVGLTVSHTWVGDLHLWLVSPHGTRVDLLEDIGLARVTSAADGLNGVVLDDDAATSIQTVPSGDGPAIAGTYKPSEELAKVADEDRAGTWELHATDDVAGDTGAIQGWSLSTDQPTCAGAPTLPDVATGAADAVTAGSARLTGTGADNGTATSYAFDYGTTTAYGTRTAATGGGALSAPVVGLTAGATYHYRALALRDGTVVGVGADRTFTAVDPPAVAPPATPPATTTPTPPTTNPGATVAIGGLAGSFTLDARGRVTLAFTVTGAKTGTVTLRSASAIRLKRGAKKRVATLGAGRFTVGKANKAQLRLTLTKAARSYLAQHGSLKAKATFTVSGKTVVKTLTLKKHRK